MTINWLNFKLVLHFAAQLNTSLVRICIFFDYPLMVGSARTEQWSAFPETPAFGNMGDEDSAYNLVLSTNQTVEEAEAMECDEKITLN